MIGWIVAILVGAFCGWIGSRIMNTDAQQGALANIAIGVVGAALAQFVFGNLLGIGSADVAGDGFNFWSLLWGVIGSVILIWILKALNVLR